MADSNDRSDTEPGRSQHPILFETRLATPSDELEHPILFETRVPEGDCEGVDFAPHMPFSEFHRLNAPLQRTAFTQFHSTPFLVFGVRNDDRQTIEAATYLAPLAETERNTSSGMITLGRTTNNDIVIRHPCVSKFHAYCTIKNGRIELTDVDSRGGTEINGEPVDPILSHELVSGDWIRFATQVDAVLMSPDDLWRYLQRAQAAAG